jgi:nucleotide-binding universal stress UspA family protein
LYWVNLHDGQPAPLTVRILGRDRDVHLDLGGGNRIPKISERKARSVAELRASGVGVDRVMLVHDGSAECSDLFQALLTMLDPHVGLALVPIWYPGNDTLNGPAIVLGDKERARQLGRHLEEVTLSPGKQGAPEIVQKAKEGHYDLIVVNTRPDLQDGEPVVDATYLLRHAQCRVFLASPPAHPQDVEEEPPAR